MIADLRVSPGSTRGVTGERTDGWMIVMNILFAYGALLKVLLFSHLIDSNKLTDYATHEHRWSCTRPSVKCAPL